MTLEPGDMVADDGRFMCPFCEGVVVRMKWESGHGIAHAIPFCNAFARLTADQYLEAVNAFKGKRN